MARWFLANYVLLNAVCFVWGLAWGTMLLATSDDFVGNHGSALEAVFWWAVGAVFYLTFLAAIPVLAVVLSLWWFATHLVGHPRLTAYVFAAIASLGALVLIPNTQPSHIAILVALPVFAYASIARSPHGITRPIIPRPTSPTSERPQA